MDFKGLFEMQGMLFSIMILGLFLRKKKIVGAEGKKLLTDLVIDVTLPASILKSFQIEFNGEILKSCMVIGAAALIIQVGSYMLDLAMNENGFFNMQQFAPMREFLAIRLLRGFSVVWDFYMLLFM